MNERILDLAIKSGHIVGQLPLNANEKIKLAGLEKFAELIVQECMDVVDVGGEFVSRPKMVERLKEHFGVEE